MKAQRRLPRWRVVGACTAVLLAGSVFTGTSGVASDNTAPACGGELARTAQGTLMTCSFDDEFSAATGDATALDRSKWVPQQTANSGYVTGPSASPACYVDSPGTIAVSDGDLHLSVQQQSAPFTCSSAYGSFTTPYTAGMVSTSSRFSQTYGRYEVRAKLPSASVPGLQETLWLWPVNSTKYGARPASGEIDFAEFYSQFAALDVPYIHYNYDGTTSALPLPALGKTAGTHDPTRRKHPKHHKHRHKHHKHGHPQRADHPAAASPDTATQSRYQNVVTSYGCVINVDQFNTYAATWSPGRITIELNGKPCLTDDYQARGLSPPAPFDQPFFIALTQALGSGTNAFSPLLTPLPATTEIDYVRAWS